MSPTSARQGLSFVARFVLDEGGQDLIEYGLLSAIIGIAGILVLPTIATTMETVYNAWNTAAQNAWEPCPPGGCP
jgi:Flp pilus assembly pilin Flp